MTDKNIQKATKNVNAMSINKTVNIILWNIIILLQKKHLSFSGACLQMNATILIKLTRRNIKLNKLFLSLEAHDHQIIM